MKYTQAKKLEYEARWRAMVITKKAQAEKVRDLIAKGRKRYEAIGKQTGVPWEFIGLTHYRECACNWKGVLHNGQLIVGTGRVTTIVPKGYGPFDTWEEAALSALKRQELHLERDWSIGKMAYRLEGFNGYGYQARGIPSPYLWGGTNQYIRGKYVRDHVFDPNFVDPQMGCMPVLKLLQEAKQAPSARPEPGHKPDGPPVVAPKQNPAVKEGSVSLLFGTLWTWAVDHRWEIAGVAALVLVAYLVYKHLKKRRLSKSSPKAEEPGPSSVSQVEVDQPKVAEAEAEKGEPRADGVVIEVNEAVPPTEGGKTQQ